MFAWNALLETVLEAVEELMADGTAATGTAVTVTAATVTAATITAVYSTPMNPK